MTDASTMAKLVERLRAHGKSQHDIRYMGACMLDAADALERMEADFARMERLTWGYPSDDGETTYSEADEYAQHLFDDGYVTKDIEFDWTVATELRREKYRFVLKRDEEGTVTEYELVKLSPLASERKEQDDG